MCFLARSSCSGIIDVTYWSSQSLLIVAHNFSDPLTELKDRNIVANGFVGFRGSQRGVSGRLPRPQSRNADSGLLLGGKSQCKMGLVHMAQKNA